MCLIFNTLQYSPISFARFFGTIYQARLYATTHAKIHRFDGNIFANYTRVYKVYYNEDFDIESYDYQNDYIEMYEDNRFVQLERIQYRYKQYHKRKMDAVILLQNCLKQAIANPRTELCKKRLIREFNGM